MSQTLAHMLTVVKKLNRCEKDITGTNEKATHKIKEAQDKQI